MSFDPEDVMKRVACPVCGECCEDYAPGVSSVTYRGELYHPHCLPMASADYARAVHDLLTSGATQTRPLGEHPLLSESETEEMIEDFLLSVPAKVFAAKLEKRDVALFEQSIDRETATPCKDVTAVTADQQDRAPLTV